MKKCLIILNESAGGSKRISVDKVKACLGEYDFDVFTLPADGQYDLTGYDAVAACGGDGTLANVMKQAYQKDMQVFYFPVGTLNDKAKAERYSHAKSACPSSGAAAGKSAVVGRVRYIYGNGARADKEQSEAIFTYVFAAGSFTPIGYTADIKAKKKLGALAYIGKVLREYRVHRIGAEICADGKFYSGDFTLIMLLKSPRCFGFTFNKAFDPLSASGHLVAIRSPKHRGMLGKIEMFFPFFRVFFLGLKKEREGRIIFRKIYSATLSLKESTDFCSDGELNRLAASQYRVDFVRSECDFYVIEKF